MKSGDGTLKTVREDLAHTRYPDFVGVACTRQGEGLALTGSVSTFYLKQVAQTIVKNVDPGATIHNRIEVI